MPSRDSNIFAAAPLQALLADESALLSAQLQRCAGQHALLVSAALDDEPPALPLLGRWTRLALRQGMYQGDLRGRGDEPLPFVDEAFELILLRHALEVSTAPSQLLREAVRVLAPGGLLVLTGLHPISGWLPWLLWQHGAGLALDTRLHLSRWLRAADLDVERSDRAGASWPSRLHLGARSPNMLGGSYLLHARKRRRTITALPLRALPQRAPANVGLAPGARRSAG
jgi:SAM-dependent methyltransferase